MKHWMKRGLTLLLAILLVGSTTEPALAAAPRVTIDESVYVNLDCYGVQQKLNIVKGCTLNGNTEFTDYGSYDKVTNMSNDAEPQITGNSVSWALPNGTGRFYYECAPKDNAVKLPWDFDISYRLNGTQVRAEETAGASGIVEINIKAEPNPSAGEYYRNNLMLMVAIPVDMEKMSSVDAPGSQMQAVGSMNMVVFSAMPGEKGDFTVRIGSKSFELPSGIMMVMVPGTMDAFQKIADLKTSKEKLQDSGNALYESMNNLLTTLQSMSSGMEQMQSGLDSLDSARGSVSASRGELESQSDQSLSSLKAMSDQMAKMAPHLDSARKMSAELHQELNDSSETIQSLRPQIDQISRQISNINQDARRLRGSLSSTRKDMKEAQSILGDLSKNLTDLSNSLPYFSGALGSLKDSLGKLQASSEKLNQIIEYLANADPSNPESQVLLAASETLKSLNETIAALTKLTALMEAAATQMPGFISNGKNLLNNGSDLIDDLRNVMGDTMEILDDMSVMEGTLQETLTTGEKMIDQLAAVTDTMNTYYDDTQAALTDSQELLNRTTEALNDSYTLLNTLNDLMKKNGGKLDDGSRNSLRGMIDVMQKGLEGIDSIPQAKSANDTIKKTIDDEFASLENNSNLLKMDPKAVKVSFTSGENPEPNSLQVILRTEEITASNPGDEATDPESSDSISNPFARMMEIFKKIWAAIMEAFAGL